MALNTTPYWITQQGRPYPGVSKNLNVDVVVIGGGMTGVTAAYLLKAAGLTVAVLERGRCGGGETSHTTAHLSAVTDLSFKELTRKLGKDHAQAVWDAGFAAINQIDSNVRSEAIDCDFAWSPGFLFAAENDEDSAARLREEAALALEAGFDAEYLTAVPLFQRPGVRFDHQARFHPLKYLHALAAAVPGNGSHIFENSAVDEVVGDALSVKVGNYVISAGFIVVATHVPIAGKTNLVKATLLQTDLYPYSTYAVAAKIPPGTVPDGLYWDDADPYRYLRLAGHRQDIVIFGGADHKTGQADDTRDHFANVERQLHAVLPQAEVTHRWSGQVIETRDGLPYIGETSRHQFSITGFSGNGITFGTLGAMMARDAATGRSNPWRELFDAGRTDIVRGAKDYVTENKDYPYYLIRDRFAGPDGKTLRSLPRGMGKILELDGERVAAYRDTDGTVTQLSPICTHLGCQVAWNAAETTWDCPCHGSRFTATGKVIGGPAETPLAVRPAEPAEAEKKKRAG